MDHSANSLLTAHLPPFEPGILSRPGPADPATSRHPLDFLRLFVEDFAQDHVRDVWG